MDETRGGKSRSRRWTTVAQWLDSSAGGGEPAHGDLDRIDWLRCLPFLALHIGCVGIIWWGWSWTSVSVAVVLYVVRMFAITGFYHRYFSHKSFKASRLWQFCFAVLGNASAQRGPLWWAAHHRDHHARADQEEDLHSPMQRGFFLSHMGWLMTPAAFPTRMEKVRDWAKFPELVWLNRFDVVVPLCLAGGLYGLGEMLRQFRLELGTNGPQMLLWGFFISTVVLFHATCTINSLDHMWGTRRYDTPDTSRNNAFLALLTLGEGWHNNHHHYAITVRQGFFWWEVDITYYGLVLLSWLGIVHDLRPVPDRKRIPDLAYDHTEGTQR